MKSEELIKLKEKVQEIKQKRDKVLEIQEEIKKLEECEEVKKYIKLLSVYEEMTPEKSKKIVEYTEKDIINIALGYTKITPSEDIYVYIGTYKNGDEFDIVHGPSDILVSKNNKDADYILYQSIFPNAFVTYSQTHFLFRQLLQVPLKMQLRFRKKLRVSKHRHNLFC